MGISNKSQQSQLKRYLTGFFKGIVLIFLCETVVALPLAILIVFNIPKENRYLYINYLTFHVQFIVWVLGLMLANYFVLKYKFPRAWALVALFLGAFILPFLLGYLETKKVSR